MNPRGTRHATPDGLDWHELEVANPSFFIEKLRAECSDLQGLRELTVKALQAIAALARNAVGRGRES